MEKSHFLRYTHLRLLYKNTYKKGEITEKYSKFKGFDKINNSTIYSQVQYQFCKKISKALTFLKLKLNQ